MGALFGVEAALGRERQLDGEPGAQQPRPIDLDLLLYGTEIHAQPDLMVPHPALHQRAFVLVPLTELDPSIFHPALGRSVRRLLEDLRGSRELGALGVRRSEARW
jgi:2-amino-4-hydroxy-6-hydroxymethyldihydropteridine diphosphokinase